MTAPFPTRNELKCSGCSFIIAHLLMMAGSSLYAIDYNIYDVTTEEQVIALHGILSSEAHRVEIEVCCALIWISFPFLLMGLFGIKAFMEPVYGEMGARMLLFVIEKSYLIWITFVCVLVPALCLTTVSFEWSFHEYTPEADFIATGYYLQLFSSLLTNEIIDCIAIADATFLLTLFILPRFLFRSPKFKKLKAAFDESLPACLQNMRCFMCCANVVLIGFALSCFVIFITVLFSFGSSGFHSPMGSAKFLLIWSNVVKLLIGLRIFIFGATSQYDKIKDVFTTQQILSRSGVEEDAVLDDHPKYQMETIEPQLQTVAQ